jgi:hypothetical protein
MPWSDGKKHNKEALPKGPEPSKPQSKWLQRDEIPESNRERTGRPRNCSPPLNRRARCRRSIGRSVHAGRGFNRVPILVSTTSTENSSGSKPRSIHSDHPSTWERDGSAKAASKF